MTNITVSNYTDEPLLGMDLREAIANLGTAGGTISFDSTTADVQLDGPLDIAGNVTIYGGISSGSQPTVTISQTGGGDVLTVLAGANVTLEGVDITGGKQIGLSLPSLLSGAPDGSQGSDGNNLTQEQEIEEADGYLLAVPGGPGGNGGTGATPTAMEGGGIINLGTLTLIDSMVRGNEVTGSIGNGGGGGGMGGQGQQGLPNGGNAASGGGGGAGGDGSQGGTAEGGGIYNAGTLDLIRTSVIGNVVTGGAGGGGGDGGQGGQGGDGGAGRYINEGGLGQHYLGPGGRGGNSGNGGDAGNGGAGGEALGAGIYNTGVVLLQDSLVGANLAIGGEGGEPGNPGLMGFRTVYIGETFDVTTKTVIRLYGSYSSIGGSGSPQGAPGGFGSVGGAGTAGSTGVPGGDLNGGLAISTGALSLTDYIGHSTKFVGLSISDSLEVDANLAAGSGLLYLDGNAAAAAHVLKLQGTAAEVTAELAAVNYEGASKGVDTVTFTALDGVVSGRETITVSVICFAAGTCIATTCGEVPVEKLAIGDRVLTLSGNVRPIKWIGTGQVRTKRGRRNAATPVIIRKGAIAGNVPNRDLCVTKAHSIYIDDVLIPVEFLVNHRSIIWDDHAQEITIYHVELETHDILLANGTPAESYRDDGNRWLFKNSSIGWSQPAQEPCAPVLTGGPIVDAAWRRLLNRSGPRPGMIVTENPDLHLLVDGVRLDAVSRDRAVHTFRLPSERSCVRIASRAGVPSELGLARDARPLGVALESIALRQGSRFRITEAADDAFTDGFHPFESDCGIRWTDGDADLPLALLDGFNGPADLVLTLAGTTLYPILTEPAGQIALMAS